MAEVVGRDMAEVVGRRQAEAVRRRRAAGHSDRFREVLQSEGVRDELGRSTMS
jgi:hypothetical protein